MSEIIDFYYIDFNKDGDVIGEMDINLITDEAAVMESISNIMGTQPGERVMHPQFGCNLDRYVFEPIDGITSEMISEEIINAIVRFEPRVSSLNVVVTPYEDLNTYDIAIYFTISSNSDVVTLNTTFKKIR